MATYKCNSFSAALSTNERFRAYFSFEWLRRLDAGCRAAFAAAGIPAPGMGETPQRRCARFALLLAARPWPVPCEEFWDAMQENYLLFVQEQYEVQQARARERCYTPPTAMLDDLVREQMLFTFRNAGSWLQQWEQAGADPAANFFGWLLADLPTKFHRRGKKLPQRREALCPAGGEETDWFFDQQPAAPRRRASESLRQGTRRLARRLAALDEHLDRLPPLEQRVLRLSFGLFPLMPHQSPLAVSRIAELADLPRAEIESALRRGLARLGEGGMG